MSNPDSLGVLRDLIQATKDIADLASAAGHMVSIKQDFLPYPDNNFEERVDDRYLSDTKDKFNLLHVYQNEGTAFVPDVPASIKLIEAEYSNITFPRFTNPIYVYNITIEHGNCVWKVTKRYRDFLNLHKALLTYVQNEMGMPVGQATGDDNVRGDVISFPIVASQMLTTANNNIQELVRNLWEYLNKILKYPKFRQHLCTRKFFKVSSLSFVDGIPQSDREGILLKRSHDNYHGQSFLYRLPIFGDHCKIHHNQKWFAIKDTYFVYIRVETNELRFPMLIDRQFQISTGFRKSGAMNGIKTKNEQRTMFLKCSNRRCYHDWYNSLVHLMHQAREFGRYAPERPFNSYAPPRKNQYAHWFINGKSYMKALAKALRAAKEEVFITDWWLSPELLLNRPTESETDRLDHILGRIADAGVRVYVLLYKELPGTVNLYSLYAKRRLVAQSSKGFIRIIRHPNHAPGQGGVYRWSHHEKMVIIDQKILFAGGIDLCFGRWDDEFMRLVDLGNENDRRLEISTSLEQDLIQQGEIFTKMGEKFVREPGTSIDDFPTLKENRADWNDSTSDVTSSQDKAEQGKIKSLARRLSSSAMHHMNLRRNKLESEEYNEAFEMDGDYTSHDQIYKNNESVSYTKPGIFNKWHKAVSKIADRKKDDIDEEDEPETPRPSANDPEFQEYNRSVYWFPGKDYSNDYQTGPNNLDKYYLDGIDRKTCVRMPWHDEAFVIGGQVARDAARHFIQRWNIHKCEKFMDNPSYTFLLPKSYDDPDLANVDFSQFLEEPPFQVDAQCVRSASTWSAGLRSTEASIADAYLDLIKNAKHFILIENQFFITTQNDQRVTNQIGDALYKRILFAHRNKQKFRVYVVLPLIPGFDGVTAAKIVMSLTLCSISKRDQSLFRRLEREGVDPRKFIRFFGMRTHDILMCRLVQEVVYVHSKLMIVDDMRAICGSANINERSLRGDRDSEFAVVFEDVETEETTFNGKTVRVGKFCSSWRRNIFKIYLGIHQENPRNVDVTDPTSDEFFNFFCDVAAENSRIYDEVFRCVPTNNARSYEELSSYRRMPCLKNTNPIKGQEKLRQLRGVIVEYPLEFLVDENPIHLPLFM